MSMFMTYMFPTGKGGFEGSESLLGIGLGGVLREDGSDKTVENRFGWLQLDRVIGRWEFAVLGEFRGNAV